MDNVSAVYDGFYHTSRSTSWTLCVDLKFSSVFTALGHGRSYDSYEFFMKHRDFLIDLKPKENISKLSQNSVTYVSTTANAKVINE